MVWTFGGGLTPPGDDGDSAGRATTSRHHSEKVLD